MRMTQMMATAMVLAVGTATGTASAQDALGGKTAAEVIKMESQHVEQMPGAQMPTLLPGDEAPELKVATYVKGSPISEFEKGTAYMVDFWATWCGPCIAAMPHMTSLQEKYEDDNFRLIGVSIWERAEGDALIESVTKFVDKRDDKMGYTVAIDDNGTMAKTWMEASGQDGIPTAMLVGRDSNIAWIGYGNDEQLDTALEQVINGTWDTAAAREERLNTIKDQASANAERSWYGHFVQLARGGETERATALAAAMLAEGTLSHPQALNGVAWTIVENEGWSQDASGVARDMAIDALDQIGWEDAAVLDTLGWAYYRLGEFDKAIETETKALEHAGSDEERAAFEDVLKTFKAAASGG